MASDDCQRVVTSTPLLRYICDFQHGVYHDVLPFLQFSVVESQNLLQYAIQAQVEIFATLQPWLKEFGLARLDRLITTLPFMKSILLLYGARVGDCVVLETITRIDGVQTAEILTNLLNVAMASNHIQVIESLYRLGYTPDNDYYIGHLFCGMGEAIAASNMAMAQFLERELSKVGQATSKAWFELDQLDQRRLETSLKQLVDANEGDLFSWLLKTWSRFASQGQLNFVRRYWRGVALELSKWTLLASMEDPERPLGMQFSEDLHLALKIPSLPAVQWLLERGCRVNFIHITNASRAWRSRNEMNVRIDIFDHLWTAWLAQGATADAMETVLFVSNQSAWQAHSVQAIDLVWSKGGKPPIQNVINAARYGSSLEAVDFTFHRLKHSMPVDKLMALEMDGLLAAIRSNKISYVEWWLGHVEIRNQDLAEAVLRVMKYNTVDLGIRVLVESKCKAWPVESHLLEDN
ncbi:unnamed protein product [Aphanomyces euteiches]|uniref:Uncharacterized protein n=1 Tax=Aphanomyces euteiches TaxID=100861 RepID=A0A6G0WH53_9STRA|nr:hypothetical protein Ae201684_015291 [Aphanomyces euteiches]KAH9071953.1 hypothetical protein Ae201684P_021090 [Aphanomyces euteiches]KAH9143980.1 hypothetical protein AeRB84_012039 [Aphanomyces euteiches]